MTKEEALNKAASYCSMSEKCECDVREKLYKWGVDEDCHDTIIERLALEKFIDEERYAIAYAKDKFRFNHWGNQKIRMMLRTKKISNHSIDIALSSLDITEYDKVLSEILRSKLKTIKYTDLYQRNGKLMQYAVGKGFELDAVQRILKDI